MWPFSKKKYLITSEEYRASKDALSNWYVTVTLAMVFLGLFGSFFVAKIGLWAAVPSILAFLVLSRALVAVKKHKEVIELYFDQERADQLERNMKNY